MSMRNVCAQIVRRKVGSFGCVCFRGAGGENVDETERELVGTQLVRGVSGQNYTIITRGTDYSN